MYLADIPVGGEMVLKYLDRWDLIFFREFSLEQRAQYNLQIYNSSINLLVTHQLDLLLNSRITEDQAKGLKPVLGK